MRDSSPAAHASLLAAAQRGDVDGIRRVLNDPSEFPNVRDPYQNEWVLTTAIFSGPTSLVMELLELGANPNVEDPAGFPPILAALDAAEPFQVLQALVQHGADLNARGTNDWTVLHRAANGGHLRIVEYLLDQGADPSLRTRIDDYATPLEEAELAGHREVARLLRAYSS